MKRLVILRLPSLAVVLALYSPCMLFGQPVDNFASMRAYADYDQMNDRVYQILEVEAPRSIRAGRYREAESLVEQAVDMSRKGQIPGAPPLSLTRIADVFREAGQTQACIQILTTYQSLLEKRDKLVLSVRPFVNGAVTAGERIPGLNPGADEKLRAERDKAIAFAKERQIDSAGQDAILLRQVLESLALAYIEMGQLDLAKESLAKAAAQKVPSYNEWIKQTPGSGQQAPGFDAVAKDFDERVSNSETKRRADVLLAAREGDRNAVERLRQKRLDWYKAQLAHSMESMKAMVQAGQLPQSTLTKLESRRTDPDKQYGEFVDREYAAALLIVGNTERVADTLDRHFWKIFSFRQDQLSADERVQALQSRGAQRYQTIMAGPQQQGRDFRLSLMPNGKELSFSLAITSSDHNLRARSAAWVANSKGTTHEKHLAYNVIVAQHRDPAVGRLMSELRDATGEVTARSYAGLYDPSPQEAAKAELEERDAQRRKLLQEHPELLHDPARYQAAINKIQPPTPDRESMPAWMNPSFFPKRKNPKVPEFPSERVSRLERELKDRLRIDNQESAAGDYQDLAKRVDPVAREYEALLVKQVGRPLLTDPWVSIESVRQALAPGEYLVDIVVFRYFDAQAPTTKSLWKGRKYAAWIIPPKGEGEIQFVDLGDAEKIDGAIDRCRQALANVLRTLREVGERESEALLRKESRILTSLLWTPLSKHLMTAKSLTVCPDGKLWLYPWEALPTGKDAEEYLVEKLPIHYVVSARDVITGTGDFQTTPPVILANPTFDQGVAPVAGTETPIRAADGQGAALLPKVPQLPATAAEARAIFPSLHKYAGQEPIMLTEDKATETRLRQIHNPHTLVLATHGFVIDLDKVWNRRGFDDPMLRSGVLLAGCNAAAGQPDDGVLTALEAMSLNLVGTKLVVLSACESALGDVREGESVAGLRQAFLLAGAKAVVATTWSIPDVESARLMNDFFGNLAQSQPQPIALRNAQLAQIKVRRAKYGAAHPFYWAAYTLTGQ